MVCQRDCFNCGSTSNVKWNEKKKEHFCEECEMIEKENERFWIKDIEEEHKEDLDSTYGRQELFGIVDEKDGGIIAYAIGIEHANLIIKSLKTTEE